MFATDVTCQISIQHQAVFYATMASGGMSLEQQFVNFSKFGDDRSDGTTITLTQNDKWMKQAKILDGKKITLTDTGVAFNKFKQ